MLSAYFDGELSPAEMARVDRLVADEPAWSAALASLRSLDGVLDAYTCSEPPRALPSRIVAAARRQEKSVWVRVFRLAVPAAAAAAVVLAVTLIGPWRSGDDYNVAQPIVPKTEQLALAEVDRLASQQLLFFSNMESIQTLADIDPNESLLNSATMDALAKLEGREPGAIGSTK